MRHDQDQSCSAIILAQILAETERQRHWFHYYIVVRFTAIFINCTKDLMMIMLMKILD